MDGPSGSGFASATPAEAATSRPTWKGKPTTLWTVTCRANHSPTHRRYARTTSTAGKFGAQFAMKQEGAGVCALHGVWKCGQSVGRHPHRDPRGAQLRPKHWGVGPPKVCGRRDLNPHARKHRNLNPACLPISPLPLAPRFYEHACHLGADFGGTAAHSPRLPSER